VCAEVPSLHPQNSQNRYTIIFKTFFNPIMNMTLISYAVKQKIDQLIDIGEKDKDVIYNRIIEDFGIPRPTVRRIARELKQDWANKIKVLDSNEFH